MVLDKVISAMGNIGLAQAEAGDEEGIIKTMGAMSKLLIKSLEALPDAPTDPKYTAIMNESAEERAVRLDKHLKWLDEFMIGRGYKWERRR